LRKENSQARHGNVREKGINTGQTGQQGVSNADKQKIFKKEDGKGKGGVNCLK